MPQKSSSDISRSPDDCRSGLRTIKRDDEQPRHEGRQPRAATEQQREGREEGDEKEQALKKGGAASQVERKAPRVLDRFDQQRTGYEAPVGVESAQVTGAFKEFNEKDEGETDAEESQRAGVDAKQPVRKFGSAVTPTPPARG